MIYTVGHSTLDMAEFCHLLRRHKVSVVVDVRRLPRSRRYPQFGRDALASGLAREGIAYVWVPELGGFRRGGYPAHTRSAEFARGAQRVVDLAERAVVALVCAERDFRACHRRFIADALTARGWTVLHLVGSRVCPHESPADLFAQAQGVDG